MSEPPMLYVLGAVLAISMFIAILGCRKAIRGGWSP